jgi:hypothetical protein
MTMQMQDEKEMSHWLNESMLHKLTSPEPRLPCLEAWLLQEVWTEARFQDQDGKPSEYLRSGEGLVNEMEKLLGSTAGSYFTELCATPAPLKSVSDFFSEYEKGCVVVLDGCSLREIPRLTELAESSRRPSIEASCGRSAIPSTTEHFVGDRLGLGLPSIGPSKLASRRELKERGVAFYYFQSPNEHQRISEEAEHIIVWHRFPDRRYLDSTAST